MGGSNSKNSQKKTRMKKIHSPLRSRFFLNKDTISLGKVDNENEERRIPYSDTKNDEIDQAHLMHFYFRFVWNGNFSSPAVYEALQNGISVLDVGCGPGSLILDLASSYTKSTFVGIDQNPVFPTHIKPPNVSFYRHNILDGLPFNVNKFDFVYLRFMRNSFYEEEWISKVLPEVLRVLKPDGWIEFMETDEQMYNVGPLTSNITKTLFGNKFDRSSCLSVAKFQDIIQSFQSQLMSITVEVKTNSWYPTSSPELRTTIDVVPELLRFLKKRMMRALEIDSTEYDTLASKITAEVLEHKTFSKTYRIYARKSK